MKTYRFLFILLAIFTFGFATISQVSAASQAECTFTRDLSVGFVSNNLNPATDLFNLQNFLVRAGFLASAGRNIFDETLRVAVASYQTARGISPTEGYFGPITRSRVTTECLSDVPSTGATYRLVTSTSGSGYGTVTGGGVYNEGALVTLEAIPATGSVFSGWNNGRASGKSPKYPFVITEDQVANAIFDFPQNTTNRQSRPALTANNAYAGATSSTMYRFTTYLNNAPGSVSSSGSVSGTQSATKTTASNTSVTGTYPSGTVMTLTATPATGSMFLTWSGYGPCSGGNPTCTFVLNQDNMGTEAVFKALPSNSANARLNFEKVVVTKDLNVNYSMGPTTVNPNVGSVTGTPSGSYAPGTLVTMTAVPAAGYTFTGWGSNGIDGYYSLGGNSQGGKCHNQGSTCSFVMDTNTVIYARFSPGTATVNSGAVTGGGASADTGVITGAGAGTGASAGTTQTYDLVVTKAGKAASYGTVTYEGKTSHAAGSRVTLTVTLSDPTIVKFAGWNDGNVCSGRSMVCTFTINGNETAKANFDFIDPTRTSMFSSPSAIYSAIKSALNLQKGSVQSGVAALQRYLNTKGYIVNDTPGEAGSPGNESTYFGEKTEQAVLKFQQDNGIPATGVVGVQTKEVMKTK